MNCKKLILFIMLILIAILAIGAVSAEDVGSKNNQTFQDVQTEIDSAETNTTIILNGTYYGNGTAINLTDKNITFEGVNNATLDARGLSGIFNISDAAISFNNINFINGNTEGPGVVYISDGDYTNITNCKFINNAARGTKEGYGGGALYLYESRFSIISNCTFINNSAKGSKSYDFGGGAININNAPSTLIDNCTFIANSASKGGAILSSYSILTINNSLFDSNKAGDAGACYILQSITLINNSKFINNSAGENNQLAVGGAIINSNVYDLNITNSLFLENKITSKYGYAPAIFNRGYLNLDNVTIANSTLNVTNSAEGALYSVDGYLTVNNSNIEKLTVNGTDLLYITYQGNIFDKLTFNNYNLPEAYDLRNVNGSNYITPIKDQEWGGNCWAFGMIAALESYLLQYCNETWDFSENNLKNLMSNAYPQGYEYLPNDGGEDNIALAYLARWSGPVNESDDPYNDTGSYSPENLTVLKHVQDVLFIPAYNNLNELKLAILNYGAIDFAVCSSKYGLNASVPVYTSPVYTDHMVLLVGWNDTYPGSNFGENVPDGAFIIKNSWGTYCGDEGYYYMSYSDFAISKPEYDINMIILNAENADNYRSNYQYDPLGLVGCLGFNNETAYFVNQFTSLDDETLAAFSLYALASNSTYEAKIYVNNQLKTTQSGTIVNPGYYTLKLDNKVNLAKDDLFRIEVKLTTPGYLYPVPIEFPYPDYSSKATADANQSFISKDGVNWIDVAENNDAFALYAYGSYGEYLKLNNTNVCLKAFTIHQTFQDVQTLIDNAENNTTIILDGTYYGNGTAINLKNKNITFKGINNATLDARGLSGIFNISGSIFSFNNVNFINGNSNSSGAVFIYQNPPSSFNNCNFIDNTAYEGGAIYSLFVNELKINNSKFINNKATSGGALYVFSSIIDINNSIFVNNTAESKSSSNISAGGAIFNCNNYGLTISNSLFAENKVIADYGLAPSIYNTGIANLNNVTIRNSTIDVDNHVTSSIYNYGGYLTINNSNIEAIDHKGIDLIYVASMSSIYADLSFNNTNLPEAYDLRNVNGSNYITSIKDQGGGNCWAFGSTAALESYFLRYCNETWDFSENNMKNLMCKIYPEGWNYNPNGGGWIAMALAYWSRWSGPVNESDDPYDDIGSYSPENLTALKHVQDIVFVPTFNDVNELKLAILNYGAIVYGLSVSKMYYSYVPIYDYPTQLNHFICLVGWNDTISGSNFGENVPDGAFIIKNSWGTIAGDDGYYYISYYDLAFSKDLVDIALVINNAEDADNYKSNYQYDLLGYTSSLGFNNDTGYFANQFISKEDEALTAFSLYTRGSNSTYEAKIYVNDDLKAIQSGTIVNPGYHTIKLDNKINLVKDDLFRIEVKLTTPYCLYPITIEAPTSYAPNAAAEANQSFISKDGVNWIDVSQNNQVAYIQIKDSFNLNYVDLNYITLNNTNVCLKAFTVPLVNTTIYADDLTIKAMDNTVLDIILDSNENSPLANQIITVEINDYKINLTTDNNGIAHLPVNNIPSGVYEVNFTFAGANGYNESKNTATLTVIPLDTIIEATIKNLGNGKYLISGIIKDEKANPVTEGNLDITVGDKTYSNVKINSDGTFNLIVNLASGIYDITFNLTFNNPTFYNNSTLTLKEAIVVNNTTVSETEEIESSLPTGNPLILLLLALIVIPFIRRK